MRAAKQRSVAKLKCFPYAYRYSEISNIYRQPEVICANSVFKNKQCLS